MLALRDRQATGEEAIEKTIVIGIDPSLTACGWAQLSVADTSRTKLLDMGVIKSKLRGWERIDEIMVELNNRMPRVRLSGDQTFHVAVEGYSFGAIGNAVFQLAELGGILRYDLWKQQIQYEDWAAMTWRKVIFGKGNMRKADEKDAFKQMWGLEGDLNALEAWAIARSSLMFHFENEWTKPQTEVFKHRMVELHG